MWIWDNTYYPEWLRSQIQPPKKEISEISHTKHLTNNLSSDKVIRMNFESMQSPDCDVLPIVWLYDKKGVSRAHTFQHPHLDEDA